MPGPIRKAVTTSAAHGRVAKPAAKLPLAKRLPFTRAALQDFVFYKRPKNIGFKYQKTPPPADQIAKSVDITRHDDYGHTMTAHVMKDGSLYLEDRSEFPSLNDPNAGISVWGRASFAGTGKPVAVAEKP